MNLKLGVKNKNKEIKIMGFFQFVSETGETIGGTYAEKRTFWIFPQPAVEGQIKAEMRFDRYWINTFYSLKICPTIDLIAEID